MAMLAKITLCALIGAAALAPQAIAQQPSHPFFDPAPESRSIPTVEIGRGPLIWQTYAQQKRVERVLPRIEQVVAAAAQLDSPSSAELRGLRTGRYQNALVVCGFVESADADGGKEQRRFIARPTVATLESPTNSQAFQAGWKSTGCGF
jgi:hypothetical protein